MRTVLYPIVHIMKNKFFLILILSILGLKLASAQEFRDIDEHWNASYNKCSGYVEVFVFVFDDDCCVNDNDYMHWFDAYYKNSAGNWIKFYEWDFTNTFGSSWHERGIHFSEIGESYIRYPYGSGVTSTSFTTDGSKKYIRVRFYDLPDNLWDQNVDIRISGWWNSRGAGGGDNAFNEAQPHNGFVDPAEDVSGGGSTPTGLAATSDVHCDKIVLSWNNPTGDCSSTKNYTEIFKKLSSSNTWPSTPLATIRYDSNPNQSYDDSNVSKKIDYDYRIRQKFSPNGVRNHYSEFNSTSTPGRRIGPLEAPSNLTASDNICDETEINVTWDWLMTNPGNGFVLERANNASFSIGLTSFNIASDQRSYLDKVVTAKTTYHYRIRAINICSDPSPNSSTDTGLSPDKSPRPDMPSAVANNITNEITITWIDNSVDEDEFIIVRGVVGEGDTEIIVPTVSKVGTGTRTYVDTQVKACKSYSYRIKSKNDCGESAESPGVLTRLEPNISASFANGSFDASKGYYTDRVQLEWTVGNNAVNIIDNYKVARRILGTTDNFIPFPEITGGGIFNDFLSDAGILYEYRIAGFASCEDDVISTDTIYTIGFRTKSGRVNGKVTYKGGIAVEGVKIIAESTDVIGGNSLNTSSGHLLVKNSPNLDLNNEIIIEGWIKPNTHSIDFDLFNKPSSYSLTHNSTSDQYEFTVFYNSGTIKTIGVHEDSITLNNWCHINAQVYNDSMFIFINGEKTIVDFVGSGISLDNNSNDLKLAESLPGCSKEIRIWNVGKSAHLIKRDYSRYTAANEAGLIMMLNMSEGTGSYSYDRSYSGPNRFNKNHAQFMGSVLWTNDIPTESQLSFAAYTSSSGNYQISLPYFNAGENYELTPVYLTHQFDPEERLLFVGDGSSVINGIDFEDISSFKATGQLFYKGTNCPVEGAELAVDGQVVTLGNSPVATLADGTFEVQVPIGEHVLSVQQGSHVYNAGRFPPVGLRDFQEPVTGIEFEDSTLVKVIGRIVGGARESKKKAGFGKTVNNIGTASFRLKSQLGTGCVDRTFTSDPITGEYEALVPPLKYDVLDLDVINPESPISFESQPPLELSGNPPIQTETDTLPNDVVKTIEYQVQRDFIYRSELALDVQNQEGEELFSGDSLLIFNHSQYDSDTLNLNDSPLPFSAFTTGRDYTAKISTFEEYINYDGVDNVVDRVPVLDGIITINNSLAIKSGVTIDLSQAPNYDGDTLYTFTANFPVTEDNLNFPNLSFTNTFLVDLDNGTEQAEWTPLNGGTEFYRGIIFGTKPIQGTNFVTQGPEIVDYILRDPPTSQGSAELERGTTISKNVSWSVGAGVTGQFNKEIDAGVESFVGLGFVTRNKVTFSTKFQVTGETVFSGGGGTNETTTITEAISTSDESILVGHQSDLFIGTSRNYTFGLSDILQIVPANVCTQNTNLACFGSDIAGFKIGREKRFLLNPGDFETEFVHTTFDILTYEIPLLVDLRNELLANDPAYISNIPITNEHYGKNNDNVTLPQVSDSDPLSESRQDTTGYSYTFFKSMKPEDANNDQVRKYNEQIRLWEEALKMNEEEKALATQSTRNHSLSGGGAKIVQSISKDVEKTRFFNWELQLNEAFITKLGAEIAGAGVELEHSIGLKQTASANETNVNTETNKVSYTLSDDSEFDRFTVDVFESDNGFGPMFKIVGGQSSCPHEDAVITKYYMPGTEIGAATIQLERPTIDINPKVLNNVPQDELGVFTLTLGNESFEGWEYELDIVNSTNPNGLIFNVDYGGVNSRFKIPQKSTINQQMFVTFGSEYQNDSLLAVLYSTCQYQGGIGSGRDIVDSVYFSIGFIPGCTDVSIKKPQDLWVVNNGNNSVLPIEVEGYDINYFQLERLVLEAKSSNESSWSELQTYWKDTSGLVGENILPIPITTPGFQYNWNVPISDGDYDLRVRSICSNAENESEIHSGYIDRINPHAFGSPSPADGILDPNDDILMKLNEPLDIGSLTRMNFDVRGVLNGAPVRHETSLSFDGTNDFATIAEYQLQKRSLVVEFWAKREGMGEQVILSQGSNSTDQMMASFDTSNKLKFQLGNRTITSEKTIMDQGWHHYAIVYNRSTSDAEIFIDFALDKTDNNFGTDYISTGPILVGKHVTSAISNFHGFLHELRLWNVPRSKAEIASKGNLVLNGREPGLIGNWPMDEAWGNVAKEKVRSRHAQLTGTTWSILPQNHSFLFDGIDDYLVAEDAGTLGFNTETDFTLEAWFKTSSNSRQSIFSNGKADGTRPEDFAWNVFLNSAGAVSIENDGVSILSNTGLNDNNWHHVSLVVERTRAVSLYIDGQLVRTGNAADFKGFLGPKLWIGARGWFEGNEIRDQYFNGKLDEVRIWNVARKAEQIQRDFVFQMSGNELGLMAYYPFDGVETVLGVIERNPDLLDASLNNYNLSLGGSTLENFNLDAPPIKLPRLTEKVNYTYSINNDEIFIDITDPPARVENVTIDITVQDIEDLAGNVMQSPKTWIAYINKNQVFWEEEYFQFEKKLEDNLTFKSKIKNTGGSQERYTVSNLPSWLSASPSTGLIDPNSTIEVTFTVQSLLNIGEYEQDIFVSTESFGFNERLLLDLKVTVDPPEWIVTPTSFSHSMSIVGQFEINDVISTDSEDMVSVWVNDELRGVTHVEYDPSSGKHLVFLDVYSNVTSNEVLEFRAWDASRGRLLKGLLPDDIAFIGGGIIGSRGTPIPIEATVLTELQYVLTPGWNWISFPLATSVLTDANQALAELSPTENDKLVYPGKEHTYSGGSWRGGEVLTTDRGYKIRVEKADTFRYEGTFIDPSLPSEIMQIDSGWNWIGVKSEFIIDVPSAMASLDPQTGDVIKGQRTFAIYEDGFGWGGSLDFLQPQKGYMLKYHRADTLIYPGNLNARTRPDTQLKSRSHRGKEYANLEKSLNYVDGKYSNTMSLIAEIDACIALNSGDTELDLSQWSLAAHSGDECRGVVESTWQPSTGKYVYYLSIEGSSSVDLNFQLVHNTNGMAISLSQTMQFASNGVVGMNSTPYQFTCEGTSDCLESSLFQSGDVDMSQSEMTQHVMTDLRSDAILPTDRLYRFKAGNSIELILGFEVMDGATLEAYIEDCITTKQ